MGTGPRKRRFSIEVELAEATMLELAAMIAVSALVLTFVTDATSGTVKVVRAMSRKSEGKIRVANIH